MKKIFTLLLVCIALCSFAQKQYIAKDFFTEKTIVWYGIDYSKARFVGSFNQFKDAGSISGKDLVDKYFSGWNDVVLKEADKYNLAKAFNKSSVTNDIASVTKINSATNPDGIMQNDAYTLDPSQVSGMVAKYDGQMSEGLGVVFITESYDHNKEQGSYYVVVFDIASKRVLISEKYSEKGGGFGIRNYWISTAHKTLDAVADDYGKWKKKYGK